tara:strand:- start:49 stop:330 length:282 start_codon:yes stop_codon:yes gene_type:complete
MRLNNLKIYCQTEEDQSNIFDFLFCEYRNSISYSTWEPDPVDTGSWGMFVDDFPPEVWDHLVSYLESEDSWALDEEVEMALECDEPRVYKYYP